MMLLTREELAKELNIGRATTYRWEEEGKLVRAIDEDGCVRFDLEECRAILNARAEAKRKMKPRTLISLHQHRRKA